MPSLIHITVPRVWPALFSSKVSCKRISDCDGAVKGHRLPSRIPMTLYTYPSPSALYKFPSSHPDALLPFFHHAPILDVVAP